jgi:hypothetical protein
MEVGRESSQGGKEKLPSDLGAEAGLLEQVAGANAKRKVGQPWVTVVHPIGISLSGHDNISRACDREARSPLACYLLATCVPIDGPSQDHSLSFRQKTSAMRRLAFVSQ